MGSTITASGVNITPTQRNILGYIALGSADGICCTKASIAKTVGCDVKTVDRAIAHLKGEGLVEVEARYDENGGQLGNVYRIVNRQQ